MITRARDFALLSSSHLYGVDNPITSITYDSRKVEKGSLFVALRGERVDGHDFIPQAIAAGASAILVDEAHYPALKGRCGAASLLVAKDVVEALSRFASLHILSNRKFCGIGITGSCGKTTTKEMLSSILSVSHSVAKTPGNLNSTLGLPIALMEIGADTDYAVYEMGVDHMGEMDAMTRVFAPEVALVTNIGISHLEKFGSRENIAREKAKIFLPQTKGLASADIEYSSILRERCPSLHLVDNPFDSMEFLGLDGIRLSLDGHSFTMPAVGMHNVKDAALAVEAARCLGIGTEDIVSGLENLKPLFGRSRIVRQGSLTVIEDCYNATLDSVSDAIETVSRLDWKHDKLIVLGDMRELGEASKSAHRAVGRALCSAKCDHIFLYGEEMEEAYRVLYDNGLAAKAVHTESFPVLSESVGRAAEKGDLLLIKGSRSLAMERLYDTLGKVG